MVNFLKLFCRFVPPYLWRIAINIIFSLISSLFSVFSFAAIIPLLQILFGLSDEIIEPVLFSSADSYSSLLECCKVNALYFLQEQISIKGSAWALMLISMFVILMSFLANLTSYFATYIRVPVRTGILRDIRNELYRKISFMPLGYLEKDKKGDVLIRLTNDAEEVDYSLGSLMDILIKNPTKIIVYLATLFGISIYLSWVSIGLLTICVIVLVAVGYVLKKYAMAGQVFRGKLLSFFDETLSALLNLKVYNAENRMLSAFKNISNLTRKAFNRTNQHYSLVFPLSDFTVTAVLGVLLYFGGMHILAGDASLGGEEFIYFLLVFTSIIPCISDIARAGYGIRKAQASVDRINTVLNIPEAELEIAKGSDAELGKQLKLDEELIIFRNVKFEYEPSCPILKNISFTIRRGEKVAIVGHTGSGKSTLAKLIPRLLNPTSGHIFINGQDIVDGNYKDIRNQIAYVSQEPILFNDSIFNNIAFGVDTPLEEDVEMVAKLVGIHDYIISTPNGYNTIVGDRGVCLSGGQKQAISIARALLKDAPVIVLDEATSALDIETEKYIMSSIDAKQGLTKLVITHRLNTIRGCDKVIVLDKGVIVEMGRPDELLSSNGYLSKQLYL